MTDRLIVRRDTYYDSVTLMLASSDAEDVEGVAFAAAVTATPVNLSLIEAQGFDLTGENPGPNDLIVALRASSDDAADAAERAITARLTGPADVATGAPGEIPPRSFRSATRRNTDLNLAFVSVPGRYATVEVAQALDAGLNVFCFSDGLSLSDEAALKKIAVGRDLLLMGADCGTAIVDGVGLGFANAVERGPIGVVGASGTGIQEVTCLLDSAGLGNSHAIGVGGRDLSSVVGGAMTLRGMELLDADESTSAIVVISKPPDASVAARVIEAAARTGKPVVVGFLGPIALEGDTPANVTVVDSLEAAAQEAARLEGGKIEISSLQSEARTPGFVRGLFCGGSLCYEAMNVVAATGRRISSNVPLEPELRLADVESSEGDTFIDFGEDELTEGRAHPMIDPSLRNERLEREGRDPEVGAIVLDVVLGYGAHPDPADDLARVVSEALGRRPDDLTIAVALCGAKRDPQSIDDQAKRLEDAGAYVTRNSAQAARVAVATVATTTERADG
ncbi:MAG: FdrA family protein [Actinobacteria bacterium]|nr:FdrA family protein [Actinomycetota bacterium]